MNAREAWKSTRERVTLDVPLPVGEIIHVDITEKYAFGDSLDENPAQVEVEVMDGAVIAHAHLHRLNPPPLDEDGWVDDSDDDYDEDAYDTFCSALDLAVVPHGAPYPDENVRVVEGPWNHLTLVATVTINGTLHDVYAFYDQD